MTQMRDTERLMQERIAALEAALREEIKRRYNDAKIYPSEEKIDSYIERTYPKLR